MSKSYGFARCSLGEEKGQDLNRQVRELQAAGAEEIMDVYAHIQQNKMLKASERLKDMYSHPL